MLKKIQNRIFQKSGFTLIELLLVIFIIITMASVILVNTSRSRMKARDNRRKSDLAFIQQALEMYYADKHNFPDSQGKFRILSYISSRDLEFSKYLSSLPEDPSGNIYYRYARCIDSQKLKHYILVSTLENVNDSDYGKPLQGFWSTNSVSQNDRNWLNSNYGTGKDYNYYVSSD